MSSSPSRPADASEQSGAGLFRFAGAGRFGRSDEDSDPYEWDPRRWPDWRIPYATPRMARRGRRGQLVGTVLGLLWLSILVEEVLDRHFPLGPTLATFGTAGIYALLYVYAMVRGVLHGRGVRVVLVVALTGLGVCPAILTHDLSNLTFLTYALVSAVMLLPLRIARILVLVVVAGVIVAMELVDGSVNWGSVWLLLFLGLGMAAFMALIFTIAQLRAARDELQSLAVARERERLARDLHDILGHSLTTITVKAGLARRMLERDGRLRDESLEDGHRELATAHVGTGTATEVSSEIAAEVADVEALARQALTDIRATVSNYRTPSLAAEIAGARMSLQAARIHPELPHAVDDVDPELQEVFGYVVREAVTNVIRHSHADRCEIRLGRDWVEIRDNGRPVPEVGATHDGNGLAGLRERLAAVDGTLSAARAEDGGFRVLATVENRS